MNLTERNPLVIGIVAIVLIIAGTVAALTIKADTFAPAYGISADFKDTAGLRAGDRVTMAGVLIGHVGHIRQEGSGVRVNLAINHGVQVARGSTADVKVETLLGRKAVALTPPANANWSDLMRKGDHVPGVGGSPTEVLDVQADAQTALATLDAQALNSFLSDLAQVTGGKRDQVNTIIDGLNRLTATVNSRHDEVSSLIDAANAVSSTIESRNANLLSAIDNLDSVVANLDRRRAALTSLLASTQDAASRIATLIGTNRSNLDAVITELQTDLAVINRHQVDLAQFVSYLAGSVQGFSSIGYSGTANTPTRWANIFTVGAGPASTDPVFGCNGTLDAVLTISLGADPVTDCNAYVGPLPGGPSSGAAGTNPALRHVPGSVVPPSPATTKASLNALLVPLLATVGP